MTDAELMDINLHLLDIKSGDFDTYKKNHEPAAAAHPVLRPAPGLPRQAAHTCQQRRHRSDSIDQALPDD
jgi:hypothetical protein